MKAYGQNRKDCTGGNPCRMRGCCAGKFEKVPGLPQHKARKVLKHRARAEGKKASEEQGAH